MEFTQEDYLSLMRNMYLGRAFDEVMIEYFRRTPTGMWHSGIGHEAVGAGVGTFLEKEDKLAVTHRGMTEAFSKGLPGKEFLAVRMGKKNDCLKARAEWGILPQGGTIGSCFPIALGAGIALKNLSAARVVLCLFGDGAAQRGTLHECMNMANVWKLPIIWVCENNLYSITTRVTNAIATENISDFAHSYDMPGVVVDGQDVIAVSTAVREAVKRARQDEGPSLIECKTYRFREHGEGDIPTPYRTREEVKKWKQRDPIELFREELTSQEIATAEELQALEQEVAVEVKQAMQWVSEQPEAESTLSFESYSYVE